MAKKKNAEGRSMNPASIGDGDWRAESDARTLSDAEAIRSDGKRLKAAREKLCHSVTALKRTMSGLRGRRSKKIGSGRM